MSKYNVATLRELWDEFTKEACPPANPGLTFFDWLEQRPPVPRREFMSGEQIVEDILGLRTDDLLSKADFERVAAVLNWYHYRGMEGAYVTPCAVCDALAILNPEQKEFWLRVGATLMEWFKNAMVAIMNWKDEEETVK